MTRSNRIADLRAAEVAELVKTALEREPAEWPAFLEQACGDDSNLRAEVESLLGYQASARNFIEQPAVQIAAEMLTDLPVISGGERVGQYEIVGLIGSGGMGEVYLAQDTELGRKVALKFIKHVFGSQNLLRHFRTEERILAGLNHPNIAQLYGAETTADGTPYFVMEYVEGERLDRFCYEHNLELADRLRIFAKVCAAVSYAHQNLVIHRDLKPANIRMNSAGEPKLLDFGIAKLFDPDAADPVERTITLAGTMTPEYASPEQVRGEAVTTASDVYSLGVVLYELLTGEKPYRLTSRQPQEISRAITDQVTPRPSSAAASSKKSLRGDLDNIILMAMRKEPARRYASVAQFSEDISRYLDGRPVIARKDTFNYRASKFIARNRVAVAAAALIFLAILAGLTVSLLQMRIARRERAKAEVVNSFLQAMLMASNPAATSHQDKSDLTVKEVLDDSAKSIAGAELSNQPEVKADLQRIIGTSYYALGQYDLAEQNLTAALEAQVKIYGGGDLQTLQTMILLGAVWATKGDYPRANKFYERNISTFRAEQKKGKLHTNYLMAALYNFALSRRVLGDSKEAETLLREELTLSPQASPDFKTDVDLAGSVLALALADQGKFDEAEQMARAKVESIRQRPNNESSGPSLAAALTILGSSLMEEGKVSEAEADLVESEAIIRKLYAHSAVPLADNLRIQAQLLCLEQRYSEAEAKITEALQIYRASTNPGYINYPAALLIEGFIYSRTNRTKKAEELLREAVQIRTELMAEPHFMRALANGALGEFLITQKRFAEAEPLLVSSYESLKISQGAKSPRIRTALLRLVALYDNWGWTDVAAKYRSGLSQFR